jgi:hypothetical protein
MKTTYIHIVILLIAALSSFLISCEKEGQDTFKGISNPPSEIRYMDDTLKTYYFFKVGSQWIYQRTDTSAAIYDTATVISSAAEIIYDNQSSYQIEQVRVNIVHSYYESSPSSSNPKVNVYMRNNYDGVNRLNMSGGGVKKLYSSYGGFLSAPIDSISILNNSIGTGTESYLLRVYDTIINGVACNNILELNQNAGEFYDETIHIAPHFGIIKFENSYDSTQWVLKEFNLIPAY